MLIINGLHQNRQFSAVPSGVLMQGLSFEAAVFANVIGPLRQIIGIRSSQARREFDAPSSLRDNSR